MDKFILIDGNAILHRAFHALPPLTNKDGLVLNAVYGFFSMFLKIIEDLKPVCVAVCFDRPKPTFRKTLYVGYQANRPKMDGDLVPQIKVLHEVLENAGVQIFELDGFEADDVIGTLATQVIRGQRLELNSKKLRVQKNDLQALSSNQLEVIIVTGDRDMLQLVNSHVKVLAPIVGMTNMILFDEQKVKEKYGIKSSQMVDYKALVGDASDNYPGVSGIGPKTAKDLLLKYETLENTYEHIGEVNPKIAGKLSVDAEQAALAKKLATIMVDVPVTLDIDKCNMDNFNKKILLEEFERLGFKSLVKRVQGDGLVQDIKKSHSAKASRDKEDQQLGLL